MFIQNDTIAAIATPIGKGSIGIIRISGKNAYPITFKITKTDLKPRYAQLLNFKNLHGENIDKGIVIYFQGPYSYTGEDIVELQAHGGPFILDLLLQIIINYGARLARPGEFTERAYLNGKIDLTQAEAVSDIINASSEKAAKSAIKSLEGVFSKYIKTLIKSLINLRMYIEASIDFPEEEVDYLADKIIKKKLLNIDNNLNSVLSQAKQGSILREGFNVIISGKPNSGKSTLLNILTGNESAIVTNIPGTTRDILKEYIQIQGVSICITDTAGLRPTNDIIESEGIKRALESIKKADHVLFIIDINEKMNDKNNNFLSKFFKNSLISTPVTYVYNKIDLNNLHLKNHNNQLYISAKYNIGIDYLKDYLLKSIGYKQNCEGLFTARKRHIQALLKAKEHLSIAFIHLNNKCGELLAEELKLMQEQFSLILGKFDNDNLLGEIFSNFCIGK